MTKWLACLLALSASACPDITVDPDETATGPTVEFDPAKSLATGARFIPFPNDLARSPVTGKIALGVQNCESATSKATREGVLNKLDGFGTYETAMQVTFTSEVDESTLMGNVVMYELTDTASSAVSIPLVIRKTTTVRFAGTDCTATGAEIVNAAAFIPMIPLKQKTSYVVALYKGIKDASGKDFEGSYTWGLVASKENPVTLDDKGNVVSERTPLDPTNPTQLLQLQSLKGLWDAHAKALAYLDGVPSARARADVLVAFKFTTQTTTDPLDPAVATSPSAKLSTAAPLGLASITGKFGPYAQICTANSETNPTQCFLKLALGACSPLTTGCSNANYTAGATACGLYGCTAIGDVLGGVIGQVNYQTQRPNPGGGYIQGPWSDPVNPTAQESLLLNTIVVLPASPAPAAGYPTVVYGHGFGSSKESVFAIAGRLAQFGFATVAIDFSAHGSRAVRTSRDVTLGCTGRCAKSTGEFYSPTFDCDTIYACPSPTTDKCGVLGVTPGFIPPSPSSAPQCYAPFLSPDLALTRDGIRQTILDLQRTILAFKACGATGCGSVKVDPTKVFYLGISLGSLIGGTAVATSDLKAAVLNVGGAGWLDVLENTETLEIRCPLVNSLIDAGFLTGEKWAGGTTVGLCTTDAWKTQPGFATFSTIARWVLDPSDMANFSTTKLVTKRFMMQEVVGDTVVPNVATDRHAALTGLATMAGVGDPYPTDPFGTPTFSASVTTTPMTSKFIKYTSDAANVFVHSSLLRPYSPTTDPYAGIRGTLRLQMDAAAYLNFNK